VGGGKEIGGGGEEGRSRGRGRGERGGKGGVHLTGDGERLKERVPSENAVMKEGGSRG